MSIKAWLKDNLFVASAVTLPVVIVIIFAGASVLPTLWVPGPAHDFLLAVEEYDHHQNYRVRYTVNQGRLNARIEDHRRHYDQHQVLYRFHADSGQLERVSVEPSLSLLAELEQAIETDDTPHKAASLTLPLPSSLAQLRLNDQTVAPDGYLFRQNHHGSAGLFGEVFGMGRHRQAVVVEKDGRVDRLVIHQTARNRYYHNVHFLGWIDS